MLTDFKIKVRSFGNKYLCIMIFLRGYIIDKQLVTDKICAKFLKITERFVDFHNLVTPRNENFGSHPKAYLKEIL